ncbi:MAG: adenylate kinase [Clostridia bacterium]|nr:adenylate kinase [Clostridia bacterium]
MNLVFLGPPGAGKGTQAAVVSQALRIPHISTGDMFRKAMREGTPTGLKARAFIEQGKLVPDSVTIEMVRERLSEDDCKNGYLLDGFPRNLLQAEALAEFSQLDAAVNIAVADEKLIARLSGRRFCPKCSGTFHITKLADEKICPNCGAELVQRADDNPATIANRLSVYHAETSPLTAFYAQKGLLKEVDGDLPMEVVTAEIGKALAVEL